MRVFCGITQVVGSHVRGRTLIRMRSVTYLYHIAGSFRSRVLYVTRLKGNLHTIFFVTNLKQFYFIFLFRSVTEQMCLVVCLFVSL